MESYHMYQHVETDTIAQFWVLFSATDAHELWVIAGAFSGSVIFIVYAVDFKHLARLALFFASFLIGIFSASFTAIAGAEIIERLTGSVLELPDPVGAVIASAIAVRLLTLLAVKPKESASVLDGLRRRDDK